MGRVRCIICGEKIPPEDLDSFRGEPLCTKHSDQIAMEIARLRGIHKSGVVVQLTEEEIHNWAETFKETLRRPPERLNIDQKETDLARKAIRRIGKVVEQLGLAVEVEKIDPSTLRLLYLKLDELGSFVNEAKKPIVDTLAGWARRLR